MKPRKNRTALSIFKTVSIEGMVWTFTKPQWLNYVLDGIEGTQRRPLDYGAKFVCGVDANTCDWKENDWIEARDEMMS